MANNFGLAEEDELTVAKRQLAEYQIRLHIITKQYADMENAYIQAEMKIKQLDLQLNDSIQNNIRLAKELTEEQSISKLNKDLYTQAQGDIQQLEKQLNNMPNAVSAG